VTKAPVRRPSTLVWIATAGAILASGAFLAWRVVGPSDGGSIPFYADAWTRDGVRVDVRPAIATGLRNDDVVIGVAGQPLTRWLDQAVDPRVDRSGLDAPDLTYTVRRAEQVVDVPVALGQAEIVRRLLDFWSVIVFVVVLQVLAGYVLLRRPEASAALALAVAAIAVTGSTLPWLLGLEVADIARGWPFVLYALTAGGVYMLLWPAGALHLPLAMASGPAGPSRRVLQAIYGLPLGAYVIGLLVAAALARSSLLWLASWASVQLAITIPIILIGLGLSVRGFRRAAPETRLQARWAAIGGGISTVASLALLLVPQLEVGRPILPWNAVGLVALPLPLGIAAGILRYQLFDIDVVLNRTLVYGGATTILFLIYAVVVTVIGAILPIQGGFLASLLATGLAAVAALPIRDSLQRTVNRLLYGDRDDPYRALTRLGRRLEASLDPVEAPDVIARTVAESLRVPWAGLRLGPADAPTRTIGHGHQPPGELTVVPLVYGSEVVGDLLVAPRAAGDPLSAADMALLEALARQAGVAVHALGLTLDLIASRERLVAAREEERRRIRRDLHDGLGPTLAAIGMRAEVAADLVARDPMEAQRLLDDLRGEVRGALADVRRLVDALRPPALDELGLVGALEDQATRFAPDLIVDVAAIGEPHELPAAVEVAAYRIAVEAMTNAARHAQATTCRVRITTAEGSNGAGPAWLEIEVTDDGIGLPPDVRPGIGLVSMRERAAEVGGTCLIEGLRPRGTRVLARLPLEVDSAGVSVDAPTLSPATQR
jgi:signal transduction histidine kinase